MEGSILILAWILAAILLLAVLMILFAQIYHERGQGSIQFPIPATRESTEPLTIDEATAHELINDLTCRDTFQGMVIWREVKDRGDGTYRASGWYLQHNRLTNASIRLVLHDIREMIPEEENDNDDS